MDNHDGFWTEFGNWAIKGFVLLGLLAVFLLGVVTVVRLIGVIFN